MTIGLDLKDAAQRKDCPIATGCVDYFPKALAAIAECSKKGNDQHNPGKPLHWDRSKSGDESDALMRHFVQRGTVDTDGVLHSTKVAWRALAALEKELEAAEVKPADDGWIPWSGGECPVKGATSVDVTFRCGEIGCGLDAASWAWGWVPDRRPYDIVAYRVAYSCPHKNTKNIREGDHLLECLDCGVKQKHLTWVLVK